MPQIVRAHPRLSLFTIGYVIAFAVFGLAADRPGVVTYVVAMLIAIGSVTAIYRSVKLSRGVLWALSIWGLVHMAGGLLVVNGDVLYHYELPVLTLLRFDRLVHAFGFGAATLAAWESLVPIVDEARTPPRAATLAALAGMGVGAINETLEFLITRVNPESNVGGFVNTGWDLVANTLGAVVAATVVFRRTKRSTEP